MGDRWKAAHLGDGPERFDTQLTLMNARAASLIAGEPENWPPARGGAVAQGDAIRLARASA